MKNYDYVLVIKRGNSYKIGLNKYNKEDAIKRQSELKNIGIKVEVMREDEAFGIA